MTTEKLSLSSVLSSFVKHGRLPVNREEILAKLETTPFPSSKSEEWKYTDPAKFIASELRHAHVDVPTFPEVDYDVLMINGDLTSSTGCKEIRVNQASTLGDEETDRLGRQMEACSPATPGWFYLLNSASATDALTIDIKTGKRKALNIVHQASGEGSVSFPRIVIRAEKSAEANLYLRFQSKGTTLVIPVIQIIAAENAVVNLHILQVESEQSVHISELVTHISQSATVTVHTVTTGGKMVRNNIYAALQGAGADCKLFGLYLPDGKQHFDNRTVMDHISPHCTSDELYKGVMSGQSTASFNGKVFVRQQAQKTNAFQRNQNILLSADAVINSKPELEIYADDVKCSHGSTTGQFDEEAVFYLRSRGIGETQARRLLVLAFADDITNRVSDSHYRSELEDLITSKLSSDHGPNH